MGCGSACRRCRRPGPVRATRWSSWPSRPARARPGPRARCSPRRSGERVDAPVLSNAQLLLSELVTNSVRHSGIPAGAELVVRLRVWDDGCRIEVEDPGHGGAIAPRSRDPVEPGGMGLNMVQSLSERWGLARAAGGPTRVWAQLNCRAAPSPACVAAPRIVEDGNQGPAPASLQGRTATHRKGHLPCAPHPPRRRRARARPPPPDRAALSGPAPRSPPRSIRRGAAASPRGSSCALIVWTDPPHGLLIDRSAGASLRPMRPGRSWPQAL